MEDEALDLIIFKKRENLPSEKPAPAHHHEKPQQPTPEQPKAAPEKMPEKQLQKEAEPAIKWEPESMPAQQPGRKMSLAARDSIKLAQGQFCINHPWRHAYAVCSVCRLPYCYADIMVDQGLLYCINDIDLASTSAKPGSAGNALNIFSVISSAILLLNAAVLMYFMYPQAAFLAGGLVKSGFVHFLFTLSSKYYIPIANIIIALLCIPAAFTILSRSMSGLGFSLFVSLAGLMLILDEYLTSNVPYLFISSLLLLLGLGSMTYSRMTSAKTAIEESSLVQEIEWPRPETF